MTDHSNSDDSDTTAAEGGGDDGVSILFDGQKQYPSAKVTVDFTFVNHLEFDCIEIIGICIPFENVSKIGKEKEKERDKEKEKEKTKNTDSVGNSDMSAAIKAFSSQPPINGNPILNAGTSMVGLYNMSREEKQLLPIIRIFISAKSFYEKIISNKKAKDKRNKRTEQVMSVNSKLTHNMAANSLLAAISIFNNPAAVGNSNYENRKKSNDSEDEKNEISASLQICNNNNCSSEVPPYLMKIFLADVTVEYKHANSFGNNFKSHNPYEKLEKGSRRNIESVKRRISYNGMDIDPHNNHSRRGSNAFEDFYENIFSAENVALSPPGPVEEISTVSPESPSDHLSDLPTTDSCSDSPSSSRRVGPLTPIVSVTEAFHALDQNASDLENASDQAKEASNTFSSTIDNIKQMFELRQKIKDDYAARVHKPRKRRGDPTKPVDVKRDEHVEKVRKERFSVCIKPSERYASFEHLQTMGREGPGGGALDMLVGTPNINAAKNAAASTAKVVLAAAGVKASTLSKKTSVSIGGLNIPLKRTDLIPAVLPPQNVVKKQSFVSSSSSTMIFDMSVLAAPNTHTNNSTSGRRNSVTSTQRSARSRMDTLLSNCPSADNADSNSSKPLDPIRSAKNANPSASYVVNNASTLGSLGNIRRVSLSLISTSSKSSEKDNKNSKKESEKSFPSLPVVGSENGSDKDKELLFRPVISNNNGIYRRTSTMSGSPTAPKTFLGAQKQGYGNVPNILYSSSLNGSRSPSISVHKPGNGNDTFVRSPEKKGDGSDAISVETMVCEQLSTDVLLNLEKSQEFEDLKTGTKEAESESENEDEK